MPLFGRRGTPRAPRPQKREPLLCISGRLQSSDHSQRDLESAMWEGVIGFADDPDRFCEIASRRQILLPTALEPLGEFRGICWGHLMARQYFLHPRDRSPQRPELGPATSVLVTEHLSPELPGGGGRDSMMISCDVYLAEPDAERVHDEIMSWGPANRRLLLAFETEFFALPNTEQGLVLSDKANVLALALPRRLEIRTC